MTLHTLALADCTPEPWRNGGGVRRDLLVWPPHGTERLRVSVARIGRSGPFSAYAGHRRLFVLLAGDGVVLGLARGAVTVTPDAAQALDFDGAEAPDCRLIGSPCDALNLMAVGADSPVRLWRGSAGSRVGGRWRGVYAVSATTLRLGAGPQVLAPHTLAWSDDDDGDDWQLDGGQAWLLSLAR